jgi:hypothetical protein
MIYLLTKSHASSSNSSLVISIKLKAKYTFVNDSKILRALSKSTQIFEPAYDS